MVKKDKSKIVLIIIIICIVISFIYFNQNRYHAVVVSGVVINKSKDPYSIIIKILDGTNNTTKNIKIKVKDENVWNLIEINRFYFFCYDWKFNWTPVLEQIMINDDFKEIYEDKLNDSEE